MKRGEGSAGLASCLHPAPPRVSLTPDREPGCSWHRLSALSSLLLAAPGCGHHSGVLAFCNEGTVRALGENGVVIVMDATSASPLFAVPASCLQVTVFF